jgi:two-component system, cell cycle sensor histidine kinase PleC
VGTEVIVALPPERVMSALAPLQEPAPPTQPRQGDDPMMTPEQKAALRKKPLFALRGE